MWEDFTLGFNFPKMTRIPTVCSDCVRCADTVGRQGLRVCLKVCIVFPICLIHRAGATTTKIRKGQVLGDR